MSNLAGRKASGKISYLCGMQRKRIAFHTLGCKLNFSETSTISRQFGIEEFELVDFSQEADIYVVHTCSVTATAEHKCRTSIRQAHRRNPSAKVAVMGCAAQANPDFFLNMEGVSWVLGNQDKFKLGELVRNDNTASVSYETHDIQAEEFPETGTSVREVSDISKSRQFIPSFSLNDRTRSFFKVQDGCDYFCTFCSIPYMRGRSRSESVENTMQVARQIADSEVKEIILTGVNIGDFGRLNGERFIDLLLQLDHLQGIDRIRISSIEPELLTDEIIELVSRSGKLLPHFHIPLQAGTDKILGLMKRKYKRETFKSRVLKIKSVMPGACIAADVIVGFPGEMEDDFTETMLFIRELTFRTFTFSVILRGQEPGPCNLKARWMKRKNDDGARYCTSFQKIKNRLFMKASWVNHSGFFGNRIM